jgi:flagellar motor switch/type III secretory pathway protein FliN
MTALKSQKDINTTFSVNLCKDFHWFDSNFCASLQKSINIFFEKDYILRFMGISKSENILFYGDEYFVDKIPVNKSGAIEIRISSNLVSSILDNSLGANDKPFKLNKLTDIEAMLIKSFAFFACQNIEKTLNLAEVNKKIIQSAKNYHFTFYVQFENLHIGKIILTIPEYMLPKIPVRELKENFKISDFKTTFVNVNVGVGSAKITLNEIKAIENGDIIVLDDSDINKMSVLWEDNEVKFKITPNPSLIISIDSNGDNEMEEQTSTNPQNMWDSILVDIVAEFDNVKLTLGELKQISEGLVIDVGSVYENKIKLRVENQVVATGELVILNDRYGVRIDSVTKVKEEKQTKKVEEKPQAPAKAPAKKQTPPQQIEEEKEHSKENENFDYSDFEIEDESI